MKLRYWLCGVLMAALSAAGTPPAWSQQNATEDITVEEVLQRIDRNASELRELRQLLQQQQSQQAGPARLASLGRILSGGEGPQVEDLHDAKFNVKLGGRIFYDVTYGTDDGLGALGLPRFQNGQEFRTLRLFAAGEGYGIFDYKVQIDFANFNSPTAKDVYIGAKFPIGHFKIGHFKEPFSLEELTSSRFITFMERALPNAMVPGRSLGLQLMNTWGADDMGTWAVGTFFDDLQQTAAANDGDVDNRDSEYRSVNVRITRLLYYDADGRYLVHVGGAFRHTESEGSIRFRARPEIHDTNRLVGVWTGPTNSYQQYGVEGAIVWGPLSVQGEWIATDIANAGDSFLDGGYVYVSYFLTGEHRPYKKSAGAFDRVKPLENFWWVDSGNPECNFGLGAWEIAFRYSKLDYDDAGLAPALVDNTRGVGELDNYTVGVNWYWTPYLRLMFNWVHSELDDAATGGDANIDAFLTRLQLDF